MKTVLSRLQEKLSCLAAEYADLRYVELERVRVRTKNGSLDEVKETHSKGIGFRVLKEGTFGFSATRDLSEKSLFRHLDEAFQMAKRFSKIRHAEVKLVPTKPVRENWETPLRTDPWKLSLAEKISPLVEAERALVSHELSLIHI